MRQALSTTITASVLLGAALVLSACGTSKPADADTNITEMNAMDGSMNDMTVVDSATLEAGAAGNATAPTDNASNAM